MTPTIAPVQRIVKLPVSNRTAHAVRVHAIAVREQAAKLEALVRQSFPIGTLVRCRWLDRDCNCWVYGIGKVVAYYSDSTHGIAVESDDPDFRRHFAPLHPSAGANRYEVWWSSIELASEVEAELVANDEHRSETDAPAANLPAEQTEE
jgi:hypothetical protein